MSTTSAQTHDTLDSGAQIHTPESLDFEEVSHTPEDGLSSYPQSAIGDDGEVDGDPKRKSLKNVIIDKHASVEESMSSPVSPFPGLGGSTATKAGGETDEGDPAASIVNLALREPFLRDQPTDSPRRNLPNDSASARRGSPFTPLRRVRKDKAESSLLSSALSAIQQPPPQPSPSIMSSTFTNRSLTLGDRSPDDQLVMLHCSLLLPSPGEETHTFNHTRHPFLALSPTLSNRGLLLPHPHSSFENLVEDLRETLTIGQEWEVVVYAANGMMTRGAWERVWEQMERVDVELLPREIETPVSETDRKKREQSGVLTAYGSREVSVDAEGLNTGREDEVERTWEYEREPGMERESTPVPYPPSEGEGSRPVTPIPDVDDEEEEFLRPSTPTSPGAFPPSSKRPSPRRPSTTGVEPTCTNPLEKVWAENKQRLTSIPPLALHLLLSLVLSLLTITYITRSLPTYPAYPASTFEPSCPHSHSHGPKIQKPHWPPSEAIPEADPKLMDIARLARMQEIVRLAKGLGKGGEEEKGVRERIMEILKESEKDEVRVVREVPEERNAREEKDEEDEAAGAYETGKETEVPVAETASADEQVSEGDSETGTSDPVSIPTPTASVIATPGPPSDYDYESDDEDETPELRAARREAEELRQKVLWKLMESEGQDGSAASKAKLRNLKEKEFADKGQAGRTKRRRKEKRKGGRHARGQ